LPFLLVAGLAYLVVTFMGFADGNPAKLYLPRDYSGAYCGVETNWNSGPNTLNFPYLSFTMIATATTDLVVKQLLCSTAGDSVIQTLGLTTASYDAYLCACCKVPCDSCHSSYQFSDVSSVTDLQSTVTGKMQEIRGAVSPSSLFSPSGSNGDFFTTMWSEATKYFNLVCLPDCNTNFDTSNSSTTPRTWTYEMAEDNPLKTYWDLLKTSGSLQTTINDQFTFTALPLSLCPYAENKCIPMPGVEFSAASLNYCSFKMSSDVISAVGSSAAETFESLAVQSFTESESLGTLLGEFEKSIDAFIIVALLCFVIGFIYIVLLRFLIGPCVWCAVLLVLLSLLLGGAACYIKSFQCAGVSIFETGQQVAVAVTVTVEVATTNAVTGQVSSEELTGDGSTYTGVQYRTKNGYACETWGSGVAASYTSTTYSNLVGANNYCRNPYLASDTNRASTIWCFTTDPTLRWEECTPVGVIQPVCSAGYAVTSEDVRKVLEICSYVIWSLAGIYVLMVFCFFGRIQLAIAVNKVAATFVSHTFRIIGVPIVQAFVGILWILLWGVSVSFLVSQVPADYSPTTAYATYAEAYGTSNETGACTNKWPTGFVYKDEGNCQTLDNNEVGCWKCAPPRYVFDYRFAVSFFVFLWNNALNIAMGQCIIAGAVGVWFFTPNAEKGKNSPIKRSCWNVFRYHLGSLAFGSFIIAVIKFIRYLMNYFEKQAKAQKNKVMALVLRCLRCCIWCFEKCVKFLNKNAYIQIALMGKNFCTSAKAAFWLILRNALRFGTIGILSYMVDLIGLFFIMATSVGLGYLVHQGLHPEAAPLIPMIGFVMMSYVVAKLFLNVFGMAVDSTLQCFLACEEMGLGGDFVPSAMSGWLDKNKAIEDVHKD